ncbi:MAG: hypothetical protein AB7F19_07535 [Candidatus Babeliales bacterium]
MAPDQLPIVKHIFDLNEKAEALQRQIAELRDQQDIVNQQREYECKRLYFEENKLHFVEHEGWKLCVRRTGNFIFIEKMIDTGEQNEPSN